jgi:membrane associated rhomboid family serine protease
VAQLASKPTGWDLDHIRAYQLLIAAHMSGFLSLYLIAERDQLSVILGSLAFASADGAPGFAWSVFTHSVLHLNPLEFGLTITALLVVGSQVERALGWSRFLALYFGAAVFVSLAALLSPPPSRVVLGGLGPSAALLVAYALRVADDPRRASAPPQPWRAPAVFGIGAVVLVATSAILDIELWRRTDTLLRQPITESFTADMWLEQQAELTVRHTASLPHLVGFLSGLWLVTLDLGITRVRVWLRLQRAIRVLQEGLEARARVEQLLEKISREGLGALSRRERTYLKYASRFFAGSGSRG